MVPAVEFYKTIYGFWAEHWYLVPKNGPEFDFLGSAIIVFYLCILCGMGVVARRQSINRKLRI